MKQDFIQRNPMLLMAIGEAMDRRVERIPVAEHTFSPAFEQKMNRLIRAQSKPYYRFVNTKPKKAVLALAAVLIMLLTTVFSVSALREPVVRFIVEVYEKFSAIVFDTGEATEIPTTLEVYFESTWLPKGFVFDEAQSMDSDLQSIRLFISSQGDAIVFQQYTLASMLGVNTEGVLSEEILVGDYIGIYYSNLGSQTILWENGKYGFSLEGPVDKEILLRMARSLREK